MYISFQEVNMIHRSPEACPVCNGELVIRELTCPSCEVTIRGSFETCAFSVLTGPQLQMVKIFLKSRGNLKELEREFNISYPTVRSRLDEIVRKLGFTPEPDVDPKFREELLARLERGEIDADEFVRKLDDAAA